MSAQPLAHTVCSSCFLDIGPSERVSYHHGELLHLACAVGILTAPAPGARPAARQRERPLCFVCLGEEFSLAKPEVVAAVRRLAETRRFRIDVDVCWRCHERRSTVAAAGVPR
jgi:hypothetical protein